MINSENFFYVIGGATLSLIGGITIATGLNSNVQANQRHAASIKDLQASQIKEAERVELEQQKADSRYAHGCVLLQNQIQHGQSVSGVPSKTPVCDVYGITGVTDSSGYIVDVARTPDQSVIQGRISQ